MNDFKVNSFDRVSSSTVPTKPRTQLLSSQIKVYGDTIKASSLQQLGSKQGLAQASTSDQQVQDAVSRINEFVQQSQRTLDFQIDEDSGKTVISVYDSYSDELIRQIPSELALELARRLHDEEPGLLFTAQV